MIDVLLAIGRMTLAMGWKIAWGLALGFTVSAIIQASVPRERVAQAFGTVTPRSLLLATAFGCASSSCSYARPR